MAIVDPEKRREHNRRYYEKTKHIHAEARKATRDERRRQAKTIMREAKSKPCADCGVEYPYYVMDFHHRDPDEKDALVSVLAQNASIKRLIDEIAKCDVLCANCHRIREYGSVSSIGRATPS